jgi:hypothetical protein
MLIFTHVLTNLLEKVLARSIPNFHRFEWTFWICVFFGRTCWDILPSRNHNCGPSPCVFSHVRYSLLTCCSHFFCTNYLNYVTTHDPLMLYLDPVAYMGCLTSEIVFFFLERFFLCFASCFVTTVNAFYLSDFFCYDSLRFFFLFPQINLYMSTWFTNLSCFTPLTSSSLDIFF